MSADTLSWRMEVRVVPGAKKNAVKEENGKLKVYLTAPALEGKANQALIKILSEHFDVKKSRITIIQGSLSRNKVIEINKAKENPSWPLSRKA